MKKQQAGPWQQGREAGRGWVWAHVCDGGSVAVAFLDEVRPEVVAARVHRCQPTQAGAFSTRKEEGLGINIRATSKPASGNKRSTSG